MPKPISPFEGMDIRSLLDSAATARSGQTFLIWEPFSGEGRQWTYDQFVERARRFASQVRYLKSLEAARSENSVAR